MTSTKQIQANRRNGKLWGVKTSQGKEIVRRNAIKHGILSNFTIDDEEEDLLRALTRDLLQEYEPVGIMEHFLVYRIAFCMLRLRRFWKTESQYILSPIQTSEFPDRVIIREEDLCE